ncbi:outer membrane protein with beta-barrel domain [Flavobacterium sp. 1]|uniref:outer membrane beta-barrel protein n=1 Tax=Flavobacterium sp. 1 TaxID=2035200 RepID=UPI000C237724|nr:outer membrane beta-barrel protein [Flavobacterium sp. 1]PJJ07529.1 outer membrane protein with beta-barrel domain [Flavobacterium sp. 1]
MKIRVITIICFVLIGIVQSNAQVTFRPGINVGLNISNIQNTNFESKEGLYIGAFGALKLSKFYTLQEELTYSGQGGKATIYGFYYNQSSPTEINTVYEARDVEISLQYLSFVTMNKFNVSESFYFLAGTFFDILVESNFKIDSDNNFVANISKGEDVDFGIIGGLGFSLPKGFSIEGRIKKGVRDVFDDHNGSSIVNTNLVYQIGGTYTFNIK